MDPFLIPFDSSKVLTGLHESLYADHTSLSSFVAVLTAAVWSHLWQSSEYLSTFFGWRSFDATFLHILIPFLVPLGLWFGLDRFLNKSENTLKFMNHIVTIEREKLSWSYDDAELKQCLELMKKNRQDYEELLRLCEQFPGQREKADLDRLRKARTKTSGSGDLMRFRCMGSEFSDSTDTDWGLEERDRTHNSEKVFVNEADSDSERTFSCYTDEDDDAARLSEAVWRYEGVTVAGLGRPPKARPRSRNFQCDY